MHTISDFLGTDHTRCDELFAQLELVVIQTKWDEAETLCDAFKRGMERHFGMEEAVLFVAFEEATGNSAGPTSVMRLEHRHLRDLIRLLSEAVSRHDAEAFFGHADTLRIMMHQHNMKEESILYLMTDRILSERRDEIVDAMRELDPVDIVNYIG